MLASTLMKLAGKPFCIVIFISSPDIKAMLKIRELVFGLLFPVKRSIELVFGSNLVDFENFENLKSRLTLLHL